MAGPATTLCDVSRTRLKSERRGADVKVAPLKRARGRGNPPPNTVFLALV